MKINKTIIKYYIEKWHLIWCIKFIYNVIFIFQRMIKQFEVLWRKMGGYSNDYSELKSMREIHKGQRCFIVATGPSLNIDDVKKLSNECTFSMNSIVNMFSQIDWRPTYYAIQDERVYSKLKQDCRFNEIEHKFIANCLKKKATDEKNPVYFPLDLLNHIMPYQKYKYKFSENAYLNVYDGFTVTFSLIQIAVYMGFKEIYLLGADCNYSGPKQHFSDYGITVNDHPENEMIPAYTVAKYYADSHNIKIYNATRGGKLEVFERVDFDSLFSPEDNEDKCSQK